MMCNFQLFCRHYIHHLFKFSLLLSFFSMDAARDWQQWELLHQEGHGHHHHHYLKTQKKLTSWLATNQQLMGATKSCIATKTKWISCTLLDWNANLSGSPVHHTRTAHPKSPMKLLQTLSLVDTAAATAVPQQQRVVAHHLVALLVIHLCMLHFHCTPTHASAALRNPSLSPLRREHFNQTLIVLPEGANRTAIKENFQQFQKLFNVTLKKMTVNFENGKGKYALLQKRNCKKM